MTTQLAIRLPEDLIQQLDALVPVTHASRSEAVRRAIELYLYRIACERDALIYERQPLSKEELAFAENPAGWQSTPPW